MIMTIVMQGEVEDIGDDGDGDGDDCSDRKDGDESL